MSNGMRDLSGSWRKVRQRFGIAAPRVAVHSPIPWYVRWVVIALLFGLSAATAAWIYDAGRRFAGFDRNEVETKLDTVSSELSDAQAELKKLRAVANAADSRLAIERTAQQKLAQQIRTLEDDNARLREELGTLDTMLSSDARAGTSLTIYRFKVEPDVLPGEYRYHLLLVTPRARSERDFNGRLELVVNLTEDGRNAMMVFPEKGDSAVADFRLDFKYFRRVEGTFRVNPKAKVENVQARIYENGSKDPRATSSVTL